MNSRLLLLSFLLFLLTVATRFFPFWFKSLLQKSERLKVIGAELPAYIMALLVLFEIGVENFIRTPYALPSILALAVLTLIHLRFNQVLLSMSSGLLSFLLFSHWIH